MLRPYGLRCRQVASPPERLQDRLADDARAGIDAETVSASNLAVGKHTAPAGRQRRWARRAAARDGRRRRAKRDGRGWQRADILRIGAPVKRLIAKLQVQIARRAHEIDARRIERRRGIRLRKIKKPRTRIRWVGDGN